VDRAEQEKDKAFQINAEAVGVLRQYAKRIIAGLFISLPIMYLMVKPNALSRGCKNKPTISVWPFKIERRGGGFTL
jgi:hypothetical protein